MSRTLPVQVWSDVACPWCFLGKRRLEAALEQFPHREAVSVTWRTFELDPSAPSVYPPIPNYIERLAAKYRFAAPRAAQMVDEMAARGVKEGVSFDFSQVRGVNTLLAHQLALFALHEGGAGVQNQLTERLFLAYFTEGKVLSDGETLVELAQEVGLDATRARAALETQRFVAEARAEERQAAEMGVIGVPFFVIGRFAVEGAQPPELLLRVLNRAWEEPSTVDDAQADEGVSCSVDGC